MSKLRDKFVRFMYGRNGIDSLYYALMVLCFILLVVGMFFNSIVISALIWLDFVYMMFRFFSKNIYKRRAENAKFVKIWTKIKSKYKFTIKRIKEARTHRYRTCPFCKAKLRLPKKLGKHVVDCPCCHKNFSVNVII